MPKIPTYQSENTLQAPDMAQTKVRPDIDRSFYADAKVAQKTELSSIFQEAGKVYSARYEASKRAQEAVEIAKTGADAMRYRDNLLAESQKIDNEEESLKFYQEGMGKFLEEKTGQLNDPVLKAQTFETINRHSLNGEHELFNYGQERRKSKAIASVQDGLISLEAAGLKARTSAEKMEIERQAATLLDAAASSGYIMPEQAQEGKAKFKQGVATARVQSLINRGAVGAARGELAAAQPYLSASQYVQYENGIVNESKRLEGETKAKIEQANRIAYLEMQKRHNTGEAFDPEQYLGAMTPENRLQAEIWLQGANQKRIETTDAMNAFRASPVVETAEDRKIAERVYIDDVLSSPDQQNIESKTEDFIRTTGYLPKVVKGNLQGGMYSNSFDEKGQKTGHDPIQKFSAAMGIEKLRGINQKAYEEVDKELAIQARQIVEYTKLGMQPDKAVLQAETNKYKAQSDPEFDAKLKDEDGFENQFKVGDLGKKDTSNEFVGRAPMIATTVSAAEPFVIDQANDAYKLTYRGARANGMEEDMAAEYAESVVKSQFGASFINNEDGVVMKYPPENLPIWKDQMDAKKAFDIFVKETFVDAPKDARFKIFSDAQTEKDVMSGIVPSYQILKIHRDKNGHKVMGASDVRWQPIKPKIEPTKPPEKMPVPQIAPDNAVDSIAMEPIFPLEVK